MTGPCNTMLAAVIAAVCATGAVHAPTANAAKGMEVAIQDDGPLVSNKPISRKKDFKLIQRLQVSWIRVNVPWVSVIKRKYRTKKPPKHPKHAIYSFNGYDSLVRGARSRGIHVELTISGFAPAWATGNNTIGDYRIKTGEFKKYVRVVVQHFAKNVDRYEVWNEPNYISWLAPLSEAPKTYHHMYKDAWTVIKNHDPKAQVMIGETSPFSISGRATAPITFMSRVLKYGALKTDGYAHHPYDFRHSLYYDYPGSGNATLKTLGHLTSALDGWANSGKLRTPAGGVPGVYLTEYGWMSSGHYAKSVSWRAKYLPKAFQMALDNSHVKQMLQYLIVKPPPRSAFFDTSIASASGKTGKVFAALEKWAKSAAKKHKIARATPPKAAAAR